MGDTLARQKKNSEKVPGMDEGGGDGWLDGGQEWKDGKRGLGRNHPSSPLKKYYVSYFIKIKTNAL
jgi:hypothetical protein